MRRILGLIAALTTLGGSAAAAERACSGSAEGAKRARVSVTFLVDGKTTTGRATWDPPSADDKPFPMLTLLYDLGAEGVGPLATVRVSGYVPVNPPPQAQTAHMSLAVPGAKMWRRPWGMYAANMAQLQADRAKLPKGAEAAGFWGSVPMAYRDKEGGEDVNPDLLTAITGAATVAVVVQSDAGESFGAKTFDLSATAERDRMVREAWAAAAEAAKTPDKCPKALG